MQIDSIELFHVALPLRQPLQTAGRQVDSLQTVLVRMQSGESAGWGEASPGNAPTAGPEWAAGAFGCLRDWLAPAVAGTVVDSGDDLQDRLAGFRGNRFAKAALDMAWWDLYARLQGQPLHKALGGIRDAVEIGTSFDQMDTIDELLEAIGRAFDAGYARVELKFRPGWDIQMVNAVRQEFPTETIHVDCEAALRLEHSEILYRLEDFNLAMVEQPLGADDLVGHAMMQDSMRTPICLDEAITTVEQADMALELKSCRYVNIKPGRVGGLSPAMAIHDACQAQDVPCWVGAMPQSVIGTRIGLALATKANFTYPADLFPSEQFLQQDLAEPLQSDRGGTDGKRQVILASEPGIGVQPDAELLDKLSLQRARIQASGPA